MLVLSDSLLRLKTIELGFNNLKLVRFSSVIVSKDYIYLADLFTEMDESFLRNGDETSF